jgi:hypothetical protein
VAEELRELRVALAIHKLRTPELGDIRVFSWKSGAAPGFERVATRAGVTFLRGRIPRLLAWLSPPQNKESPSASTLAHAKAAAFEYLSEAHPDLVCAIRVAISFPDPSTGALPEVAVAPPTVKRQKSAKVAPSGGQERKDSDGGHAPAPLPEEDPLLSNSETAPLVGVSAGPPFGHSGGSGGGLPPRHPGRR